MQRKGPENVMMIVGQKRAESWKEIEKGNERSAL